MKLWELQEELDAVLPFSKPKIQFEQYPTDSYLASQMMHTAHNTFDDIESQSILDLGCGCGMLTISSVFFNPGFNTAVDICPDAIEGMKKNLTLFEMDCEIINADVEVFEGAFRTKRPFDTVLMNPPFGTKTNVGVDMVFLKSALNLGEVVYSMHKSSTREYIEKKCSDWRVKSSVLAKMKFKIPAMYKFHKQQVAYVDVDLWRISHD